MGRIVLFPYKIGSRSCKDLQAALERKNNDKTILRVRSNGRYRPRYDDTIINWGNSRFPSWIHDRQYDRRFLNAPDKVNISVNKLRCFEYLKKSNISIVPFTTDRRVALDWPVIVERHKLESYGGDGIVINKSPSFGHAPLYTKLLTPASEYRVHVFNGEVIDYSKKVKRVDGKIVSRLDDDFIKNRENGWEYIRDVEPRPSVVELALAAVKALGLDFGAVDIIRHKKVNYVLEIGTAAGLSPMGIEAYANAILKL